MPKQTKAPATRGALIDARPSPPTDTNPTPPRLEYDVSTVELHEFGEGWRDEVAGYPGPVIMVEKASLTSSAALFMGEKGDNFIWACEKPGARQTKGAVLYCFGRGYRTTTAVLPRKNWTFSSYVGPRWNATMGMIAIVLYTTDAALSEDGGRRRRYCQKQWKAGENWSVFECDVAPRFYRWPNLKEARALSTDGDSASGSGCVQTNASQEEGAETQDLDGWFNFLRDFTFAPYSIINDTALLAEVKFFMDAWTSRDIKISDVLEQRKFWTPTSDSLCKSVRGDPKRWFHRLGVWDLGHFLTSSDRDGAEELASELVKRNRLKRGPKIKVPVCGKPQPIETTALGPNSACTSSPLPDKGVTEAQVDTSHPRPGTRGLLVPEKFLPLVQSASELASLQEKTKNLTKKIVRDAIMEKLDEVLDSLWGATAE